MGTLLPKVNLQGEMFHEIEYVTPQDYVHFAFGHPAFAHLYAKVYLNGGSKLVTALQDLETYLQRQLATEPDVFMDALENLALKNGADPRIDDALKHLRKTIYPGYKLRSTGARALTRVFCALPNHLPALFEIASRNGVASDLALSVQPWEDFWYA